jgi:hypothetical protein
MEKFERIKLGLESPEQPKKDMVNSPDHYTSFSVEVKDMMRRIWGDDAFAIHCEMCAFKYRMRAGMKDDATQDLRKAEVYERWARQYRTRTLTGPYGD